ncbi:gluconokinase [Brevibacterium sp. GP-SGM9]|uniref:gluconokinase n=1 Tax=unclassified Brevibacterium TaxID=2614124 RepID=UPI001E31706D|nr:MULTISPECIES: gluconokinase [unclassified Brevibacterium]MCD1285669.1 transferase [Brevibacterium sp. CCUG 69071]MDK8434727.1 gluconokinase [Brevibacterium sp. H-BE7]
MGHSPSLSPLVIMGVSGTGKTVLGAQVAQALDRRFVDADDLHSTANKAKMASGTPLDDDDRAPWLESVAAEAARAPAPVIACSALKRSYRDLLRTAAPDLLFIHLDGPREVIARHLARRDHEFMSPDLLDSQLATLEPLAPEEAHAVVDVDQPIPEVLDAILDCLSAHPST